MLVPVGDNLFDGISARNLCIKSHLLQQSLKLSTSRFTQIIDKDVVCVLVQFPGYHVGYLQETSRIRTVKFDANQLRCDNPLFECIEDNTSIACCLRGSSVEYEIHLRSKSISLPQPIVLTKQLRTHCPSGLPSAARISPVTSSSQSLRAHAMPYADTPDSIVSVCS